MSRFSTTFAAYQARREGLFVPFVVLGDPTPERSLRILEALIESGADALELGLPFSDPPADGPAIQAASLRALQAGTTTTSALALVASLRRRHDLPISLLGYLNPMLRRSLGAFFRTAADAGADAVLAADVPLEEAAPLLEQAALCKIDPILIASARTTPERLDAIARAGRGYLYAVAHIGVTGERDRLPSGLTATLSQMRARVPLPILAGFGFSAPGQVPEALAAGASGVISGSAFARRIAQHLDDETTMLDEIRQFSAAMKAATRLNGDSLC